MLRLPSTWDAVNAGDAGTFLSVAGASLLRFPKLQPRSKDAPATFRRGARATVGALLSVAGPAPSILSPTFPASHRTS
jgi:hypothetical protein